MAIDLFGVDVELHTFSEYVHKLLCGGTHRRRGTRPELGQMLHDLSVRGCNKMQCVMLRRGGVSSRGRVAEEYVDTGTVASRLWRVRGDLLEEVECVNIGGYTVVY